MNIPYVYLIGWTNHDTWYCGVRYQNGCCPADLWTKYFTSSEYVKRFRKENGEPDHIEILKEFDNREEAYNFEQQKLIEFDILKKKNWLNRRVGGNTKRFGKRLKPLSEKHKRKLSESLMGHILSEATINKIKEARSRQIIVHSEETKKKIGEKHKGKIVSKETRKRISEIQIGKKLSQEHKNAISKSSIGKKKPAFTEEHKRKLSIAGKARFSRILIEK